MRKFYYVRANPKDVTGEEYNAFARAHPMPIMWIIDWVGDVEGMVIKEVTADEFNILNNNR
jgi:hypothetical protein